MHRESGESLLQHLGESIHHALELLYWYCNTWDSVYWLIYLLSVKVNYTSVAINENQFMKHQCMRPCFINTEKISPKFIAAFRQPHGIDTNPCIVQWKATCFVLVPLHYVSHLL